MYRGELANTVKWYSSWFEGLNSKFIFEKSVNSNFDKAVTRIHETYENDEFHDVPISVIVIADPVKLAYSQLNNVCMRINKAVINSVLMKVFFDHKKNKHERSS